MQCIYVYNYSPILFCVCSNWSSVLSGVPQGSVLGPILFIVYIGNVGEICTGTGNVTHCLYADDLKLYSTIKSDNDSVENLGKWENCIEREPREL